MSKILWIFILSLLLTNSCEKAETTNEDAPVVHFNITGRLLEGKKIDCIETGSAGNIWIASDKELYYYKNGSEEKTYTLDFPILALAVASDESLWIGTNGGGLGHLTQNGITWYTKTNSGLPRDYIRNVKIGPDGRIWFSSCAYNLGGLVVYDQRKFEIFTPENSSMNQHVVVDIEIDQVGNVYIVTSGKVGQTNVYRITGKSWDCLADELYWVSGFSVGPKGSIYLVVDFTLSSSSFNSNTLMKYSDSKWQRIETDSKTSISFGYSIKADKRNYCWVAGFKGNYTVMHVFTGEVWEESPKGLFPEDYFTTIETDSDNNIWIGTARNGVFIINQ